MVFNKEQIDSIVKSTEEALKWLGRKYIIIDFKEKNLRKLGKMFPYDRCQSFGDLYNIMKRYLLRTDNVVVCKELSLSKIQQKKSGIARMLIKIIDDAHFDGISPLADVVFIDYASFLEKSWENIGSYLDILTTEYRA